MSITDPHLSVCFNDKIEEVSNKLLKTFGTLTDELTGISQCQRQFVTSAVGMFYVLITNCLHLLSNITLMFCLYFAFRYWLKKVQERYYAG